MKRRSFIAGAAVASLARPAIAAGASPLISGASPKGAITLWVQVPPGQWSVGPVAGRRFGRVTGWIEALRQKPAPAKAGGRLGRSSDSTGRNVCKA